MSALPWHERSLAEFESIRAAGRLPHGLLIHGPDGWGDRQLANRIALRLLGLNELADAREIAHPDLHWVQPDGAVIKVDDIRALAAFAVGTRQSAPCKVAVIERAHLLNLNAANALLKTLEEPPRDTYLLLATSRRGRLLPTIVSRCQALRIHPDPALARQWLGEKASDGTLDALVAQGLVTLCVNASMTGGNPQLADDLADTLVAGSAVAILVALGRSPTRRA